MFVAGAGLDEMTAQVRRFNTIRAGMGLPPDQPTTLLWMCCGETASEAEEGWIERLISSGYRFLMPSTPRSFGVLEQGRKLAGRS
jgi:hypothetical protein